MQDRKKIPKKRKRVTVFRVIVALLLIAACAFAIFRLNMRSKLNARIEAIRSEGYPATFAELDEWYTIPEDAENGADAILDALSYYQEWEHQSLEPLPLVGHAELPARTEPLSAETMSLMSEYLDDNRETLDRLNKAVADIEHCRYPVDFSAGINMRMSYLSGLRRGARLLQLDAISHAEKGEPQLAVRSVMSILDLGGSLAREPLPGSFQCRRACQQSAIAAIERIANRTELTDEQLATLGKALAEMEARTGLLPMLIGYRCVGLAVREMPVSQIRLHMLNSGRRGETRRSADLRTLAYVLRRWAGLVEQDAITFLDVANDCIEALELPSAERRRAAETIKEKRGLMSKHSIWLGAIASSLPRIIIDGTAAAHLRTARVALAVQRYCLAAGELPGTLADLVPSYLDAVPLDPFDDEQIRYKKLPAGFVVYSVGRDRSDNGGREQVRVGQPRSHDITFIVER